MTAAARALQIADRLLARVYRAPRTSAEAATLRSDLHAAIAAEIEKLLRESAVTPDIGSDVRGGGAV